MPVTMTTILRHPAMSALSIYVPVYVAKQQMISHSIKCLDMLFHAQQVKPHYGYICDVLMVQTLTL